MSPLLETILAILVATGLVAIIAGAYFLYIAKQDADERNDERNLPPQS